MRDNRRRSMLGFRFKNVFFLIRRNILSRFRDMTQHTVKKAPVEGSKRRNEWFLR